MNKKIINIAILTLMLTANKIVNCVSFGNPFGVMNPDRKMTKSEIIKATRLMAAAEFEAVQNYMQVAESTDDALVKKVFTDIANEERVHAGEFLRLLNHLDKDESEFYKKGAAEVEAEIKNLETKKPETTQENKIESNNAQIEPTQPKITQKPTKQLFIPTTKPTGNKNNLKGNSINVVNAMLETETVSIEPTDKEPEEKIQKPKEIIESITKPTLTIPIIKEPIDIDIFDEEEEDEILSEPTTNMPKTLESVNLENTKQEATALEETKNIAEIKNFKPEPKMQTTTTITNPSFLENNATEKTESTKIIGQDIPDKKEINKEDTNKILTEKVQKKPLNIKKLVTEKLNAVLKPDNQIKPVALK